MKTAIGLVLISLSAITAQAEIEQEQAVRAVIGEASNQGYHGMLAVACGIRNRGNLMGVYGVRARHVDHEPMWVWDMARQAWEDSEDNRIHDGDHWENVGTFGIPSWAYGMVEVYRHKDHVFYK